MLTPLRFRKVSPELMVIFKQAAPGVTYTGPLIITLLLAPGTTPPIQVVSELQTPPTVVETI